MSLSMLGGMVETTPWHSFLLPCCDTKYNTSDMIILDGLAGIFTQSGDNLCHAVQVLSPGTSLRCQ